MIYLRIASPADIDTILTWRRDTASWLSMLGSDQWSRPYPREILERRVAAGATFMAATSKDGQAVATVTLVSEGDPSLWTADDRQIPAWYVHKLSSASRGTGAGGRLLAWARAQALSAGVQALRLDAWTTNAALRSYYERRGYVLRRVVTDVCSGALYEQPTSGAVPADDVIGPDDWTAPATL